MVIYELIIRHEPIFRKNRVLPLLNYVRTKYAQRMHFKVSYIHFHTFVFHISISTDLGSQIETFIVHMLLLKNLQFLPNDYETRSKLSTHEYFILTEFCNHWVKIVDFLIKAYFCLVSLINEQSLHTYMIFSESGIPWIQKK